MDNPVVIVAVIVAVVVAIAAFFLLRKKEPDQLGEPRPEPKPEPDKADKAKPSEPTKAEPAKAATEKKPAGKEPPSAEPAKTEPAKAEPKAEPAKAEPAKAERAEPAKAAPSARKPSQEDVAAIRKGLANTRGGFIARLAKLFGASKEINPELLSQMEEVLLQADVGVATTQKILDKLRDRLSRKELADEDRVWKALREEAAAILSIPGGPVRMRNKPATFLFVGVNGVGKTTTIGKLSSVLSTTGEKKVLLAAGDTFRAAAVAQLEGWARRTKCPIVKGKDGTDPSSVVFDAVQKAKTDGFDVVIADTAGRMHTKSPLMEELKKLRRTVEKALGAPPDEVLLVLDATTGQNAIQQAKQFHEALEVSGIVLTKLDGTAKGGVILGICDEMKIPVRYIGIGERVEDLREFDAEAFAEALFARDEEESIAA